MKVLFRELLRAPSKPSVTAKSDSPNSVILASEQLYFGWTNHLVVLT